MTPRWVDVVADRSRFKISRDVSPEAMAARICAEHWPVGTKRLVYREEVEKVMAYLVRQVRLRDARVVRQIGRSWQNVTRCGRIAEDFARAILLQNRRPK